MLKERFWVSETGSRHNRGLTDKNKNEELILYDQLYIIKKSNNFVFASHIQKKSKQHTKDITKNTKKILK